MLQIQQNQVQTNQQNKINEAISQLRALFLKNITFQVKQIGTNICQVLIFFIFLNFFFQIFTPLLCLIFIYMISFISGQKEIVKQLDYPFLFNIPSLSSLYSKVNIDDCIEWYQISFDQNATQYTKDFVGSNTGNQFQTNKGLLSNVFQQQGCAYKAQIDENITINSPFFKNIVIFYNTYLPNKIYIIYVIRIPKILTINQKIIYNNQMKLNIKHLNKINVKKINIKYQIKYIQKKDYQYLIPDGGITFYEASEQILNCIIEINDLRYPNYHRNNGITKMIYYNDQFKEQINMRITEGQISLIDLVTKAYIQKLYPNVWLISGIQYLPKGEFQKPLAQQLITIVGGTLYPLALSLLCPIFMYLIVLEKEEKLLNMMKMNGLKMKYYWTINFLFFLLMTFLTFSFFYFLVIQFYNQIFCKYKFLIISNKQKIFILNQQKKMKKSHQYCFHGVQPKQEYQYFSHHLQNQQVLRQQQDIYYQYLFVQYQQYQIQLYIHFLKKFLTYQECMHRQDFIGSFLVFQILVYWKIVQITFLKFLTNYKIVQFINLFVFLFFIFGIIFSFNYFTSLKLFNRKQNIQNQQVSLDNQFQQIQDEDAQKEQEFAKNLSPTVNSEEYPLIIKKLTKVYKHAAHKAVNELTFAVKKGQIFGLLGPNGAGKTTLISMLTGIINPTSGTAYIAGKNIINEKEKVHKYIGVCPQFDLLWGDLTIKEHLLFYARLKGITKKEEKEEVEKVIKKLNLQEFQDFQSKQLSGGMKRRLSVAISLVGKSQIVFLDEPSTGLDPINRRYLWDIILKCQGECGIVLTTHSMEEADVLCNKIAIITKGTLRCIGNQIRLKNLYGQGYRLYINCLKNQICQQNISHLINDIVPKAVKLSEFNNKYIFQVPQQYNKIICDLFYLIEKQKQYYQISDWGISLSSLEDVFMFITNKYQQ
ncbi:hypothetical protein IMG5_107500 [Ichthyophthirius multifiliis]|uniref:ABC transporter domain-containing protein n=1 Tax=Ichthyophthirius multifiliis TaxID=5932 RepID=G0QTF3_ICHMU|nr:hypothetical protein IMG5_107500 [Ichthyophthirius multifiliis]EGR31530.1 hypothetical protein IMG5_107500 [Ichthyophthirius multifiliis]|eukprot:XP_004035016.1 hypothetical protein IMG5_107500 [Ichthyophthirius multifiliis]